MDITDDTPPDMMLRQALAAAQTCLRDNEADSRSLLELITADGGRRLEKREAAQLVRLLSVADRADAGLVVDPQDADQAVAIVHGLVTRLETSVVAPPTTGGLPDQPSAVTPTTGGPPDQPSAVTPTEEGSPLRPAPRGETSPGLGTTGTVTPTEEGSPLRPVPRGDASPGLGMTGAVTPTEEGSPLRPVPAIWHVLGVAVYTAATIIIFALGPLALALMGPTWIRWLVWPAGLLTAGLVLRHLWALASRRVEWAVLTALVIGIGLGIGWGVAAESGWLPPLGYVSGAPVPSLVGNRPPEDVKLHSGGRARVEGTLGAGLRVRSLASVNAVELTRLNDGTLVQLVEGPRYADGFTWWQINAAGVIGWVADEWLTPLD